MPVVDVDLTDPAHYRNGFPHEVFADLRRAGAVHHHEAVEGRPLIPSVPFWSVVRHAEIQQVNRDWENFTAVGGPGLAPMALMDGRVLVALDPPDHTQLRRLITAGFTPRMIGALEDRIAARTADVLAAAVGECDFVRDIAYPVPMNLIADIMGIPEPERQWVFERTDLLLRAMNPVFGISADEHATVQVELFEYAQRLSATKLAHPADDVWTVLAREIDGFELDMFFLILSIAGSETTRNALSQGLIALMERPDQLQALRDDPSLIATAADEVIRWASPVLFFGRAATRDIELGGQQIRAGDRVVLWYPSGNRDERAFDAPFDFDIHRNPNPHVSFGGGGPHYCLGANLAKKEVQVVLGAIAAGYDVELLGPPVWASAGPVHNVGLSIDQLPIRLTPT